MPDRFESDLISNLRFRATWVAVAEHYLKLRPKPDATAFLQQMLEIDQEAVDALALALRQADVAPGRIGVNEDLLEKARLRSTHTARLHFIDHGIESSLAWYQEKLTDPNHPYHELWQSLFEKQSGLYQNLHKILSIHKRNSAT